MREAFCACEVTGWLLRVGVVMLSGCLVTCENLVMGTIRAPSGLGKSGRDFWRSVVAVYVLAPAEVLSLARACKTVDLLDEVDAAIADYGVVASGSRGQPVPNRLLMARCELERSLDMLIRSLALPMPDEAAGRRRSPSAAAAAQARWRDHRGAMA